ncbi:MAG: phosphate ABC transporter ATP-binding protein, partial [Synergistaceae bacterium]|nr:phosphate ABC transporter ATP-binding protein [Synergistaceae bacterium]
LLDEPTASLDKRSSELIEDHLLSLKNKYSIVMVSHSVRQALKLGSHFVLLKNGTAAASFSKEKLPEGKEAEKAMTDLL